MKKDTTAKHDTNVESHALAAPDLDEILVGAEAVGIETGIVPEDLSDPTCRRILGVVREHRQRGWPVDLASIAASFQERGEGWMASRLAEVFDAYTGVDQPHLGHYAQRIQHLARVRELRNVLASGWAELGEPGEELIERHLRIDGAVFVAMEAAKDAVLALREGCSG